MASQLEIISNPRGNNLQPLRQGILLTVCVITKDEEDIDCYYHEAITGHDHGLKQSENQQVSGRLPLGGGNYIACNCRE